jgi:hypothetical protein
MGAYPARKEPMKIRLLIAFALCSSFAGLALAEPFEKNAWELDGPVSLPWKIIDPDLAYHGQWLVAGDLDGDGKAEILTARQDRQEVTTLLATRLDGSTLWHWGEPNAGKQKLGYDVPVQIYDLDGDGKPEVYLSVRGSLLVLDGSTGEEIRRLELPNELKVADCIAFANLRGGPLARDIIIKDRYSQLWAFTDDWKPLWHWKPNTGRTCHHPTLMDIDGDGRDDVMAGYSLLDAEGKPRYTLASKTINLAKGHQDCCEILIRGNKAEEFRLVQSYCGANGLICCDGRGKILWEISGRHYESIDIAKVRPDLPQPQIVVDVAHQPYRKGSIEVIDAAGQRLGIYYCGDSRHHRLIDWDGDGISEILAGQERRLFDGTGRCVLRLGPDELYSDSAKLTSNGDGEPLALIGDLDGDQRPEIIIYSMKRIVIYRSDRAAIVPELKLGTGVNTTLY